MSMTMEGIGQMAIGVLFLIVAFTIIPIVGSQLDDSVSIPADAYASGSLNITGNVTCGQLVNITAPSGVVTYFEFNVTDEPSCAAKNGAYDDVVLARYQNTSTIAATNLTTAINANATVSAILTATSSSGLITVTYDTVGTNGNIAVSESLTNGAWSGTTLTGGTDGSDWSSTHNASIPTAVDFWEAVGGIMKIGAIIIIVVGFFNTLKGIKNQN